MLIINQLTIGHSTEPLLEDISLSLDSKKSLKVALVGPNGSGKTTLLKTIAGIEEATSGKIDFSRENIHYLPQHPEFPKGKLTGELLEELIENHWDFYRIEIAMEQVGLDEKLLIQNTETLSGGEKLRLQLAILLLQNPSILLLDEPSNHLDEQGIKWLTKFIREFHGTIILVSHHRELLNKAIDRIWEIDTFEKSLTTYPGNYDFWRKEREKIRNKKEQQFNQIQSKVQEIHSWLKANEFHPKYRFSNYVMQQKRKLKALKKDLESLKIAKEIKLILKQQKSAQKSSLLIKYKVVKPGLFREKKGSIRTGDRVQVSGKNGSGKTTLLRILAGEEKNFEGEVIIKPNTKIAWLKQHCSLNPELTVKQILSKEAQGSETDLWRLMAHFHLKDYRDRKIKSLSGGEQKRIEMALLIESKPDVLLLDEPTNHLDIYVQEELQHFLEKSSQTIIFVTHDVFLERALKANKHIRLSM
jgi:ATPase subunit of ABC transporter with duplicated ATPase domains